MRRLAASAKRLAGLATGAILLMTAIAANADPRPTVKSHPESYINADGSVSKDKAAARMLKKKGDTAQNSASNLK
jgi:hypothetical protein